MNLIENEAQTCLNQSNQATLLEVANSAKIAILTNRPLNCIQIISLSVSPKACRAARVWRRLKWSHWKFKSPWTPFCRNILPVLDLTPEESSQIEERISLSKLFQMARYTVTDSNGWKMVASNQFFTYEAVISHLYQNQIFAQMDDIWLNEYSHTLQESLKLFLSYFNNLDAPFTDSINAILDIAENVNNTTTLSQAISRNANRRCSLCIVRMRHPKYVQMRYKPS